MEKPRLATAVTLLVAMALVVAACSDSSVGDSTTTTGSSDEAPTSTAGGGGGGETTTTANTEEPSSSIDAIVISTTAPVPQIDYAGAPFTAPVAQAANLSSGGYLYSYLPDGSLEPDLAESFPEVSDDGLTVTITLRPDLVYSDGTPVEAEDAVVTFNRQKEVGTFGSQLADFASAEAPDATTIVYTLVNPIDVMARTQFFGQFLPLHPRDRVDDPAYWEQPVSATRYVITEWTPGGSTMVMEANPSYWRGTPEVGQITLSAATDPTSRVLQVTTGAVDIAFDIPPGVRDQLPAEIEPIVHPIGNVFWVGFQADSDGPIGDARVRQALCMAIDRAEINERAFLGISEPVAAVLSAYRPEWQYTDILPSGVEQDLEAARSLLAEAGAEDGFTFQLQTWGARPGWTDAAVVISENLAELGVIAEVEPIEDAVAIENLIGANFVAQFSGGGGDNITLLNNVYHPDGFWANATGFEDASVTELLAELGATTDPVASQDLQVEVQVAAWDSLATICPLNERAIVIGSRVPTDIVSPIASEQFIYVATSDE